MITWGKGFLEIQSGLDLSGFPVFVSVGPFDMLGSFVQQALVGLLLEPTLLLLHLGPRPTAPCPVLNHIRFLAAFTPPRPPRIRHRTKTAITFILKKVGNPGSEPKLIQPVDQTQIPLHEPGILFFQIQILRIQPLKLLIEGLQLFFDSIQTILISIQSLESFQTQLLFARAAPTPHPKPTQRTPILKNHRFFPTGLFPDTIRNINPIKNLLGVPQQIDPTDRAFFFSAMGAHFHTTITMENMTTGVEGLQILSQILQTDWALWNSKFDPPASLG